jgi:hypothetical protein
MEWIHLAQVKDQWRTLLITAMNVLMLVLWVVRRVDL